MEKTYHIQSGVAALETTFVIMITALAAFLLFDTARAITLFNKAGSTAAMLADVMSGSNRSELEDISATDAERKQLYSEERTSLVVLANKLANGNTLVRTSVYKSENLNTPFAEYGEIGECEGQNPSDMLEPLQSIPAGKFIHVAEVCVTSAAGAPTSGISRGISPFTALLPSYGYAYAVER